MDWSEIGVVCVSRPTNPTGNVLSDSEVEQLDVLAKKHGVPLLIDNAYGTETPPFLGAILPLKKPDRFTQTGSGRP